MERWATIHLPELREATAQRYRVSLRALAPQFEDRALEEIDRAAVAAFVAARRQGGATAATVRRDLDVLAMVLDNARDAGWIPDDRPNPANQARGRLVERREPIRPVPMRDLALALRRFPAGLAAMGRFLARTGCRQEEAASLEWRQVDLAAGTVTFAKTKTRSPRVIRLKPQALRDLKELREKGGGAYVFRSNAGDRHHNVASRWRMLVADALSKVKPRPPAFRCHDLRHTFAIRWVQQGGDIYALARHLGHASVKTTEIYLRWMVNPAHRPAQKSAHRSAQKPAQ